MAVRGVIIGGMTSPEMTIELWPLEKIRPYDKNPRKNAAAVEAVVKSIRKFGVNQPIVVDKNGVVIAGHTRLLAAIELELKVFPVHVFTGTAAQAKAYRIADNQTNTIAEWDRPLLQMELAELKSIDPSTLDALGFDSDDLRRFLGEDVKVGESDPDAIPAPPDDPVTRRGEIIILGNHRLMCGDSSSEGDLDALMDGAKVDLLNTDPPYNVKVEPRSNNAIAAGNSSFKSKTVENEKKARTHHQSFDVARQGEKKGTTRKMRAKDRPLDNDFMSDEAFETILDLWFKNASRVMRPGASFYIWGGYANIANYPPAMTAAGFKFAQAVIWHKQHPVPTRKDFMGDHEWCQPGTTMVRTVDGEVPMSDLTDAHRVISFYQASSAIVGLKKGMAIKVASRDYEGQMYGVAAGGERTESTDQHIWTVRMTQGYGKKYCVYLMRRGTWWRVGMTQMRTTWGFGLKGRLNSERGDEAWILSVHDTRAEARMHEQIVSVQFGIPQTCWVETGGEGHRTIEHIEEMYQVLGFEKITKAAHAALAAFNRRRDTPFLTSGDTRLKFGTRQSIQVRACNVLPVVMEVPVHVERARAKWTVIESVDAAPYSGKVYSLAVERHEHYIADRIITHNCFYGWKEGAGHRWFGPRNVPDVWRMAPLTAGDGAVAVHADMGFILETPSGRFEIRPIADGEAIKDGARVITLAPKKKGDDQGSAVDVAMYAAPTDVWSIKKVNPQSMVHLTEKPAKLAAKSIGLSSRPGENVLDLFGGSGSTLIACEQLGRKAYLMELDPAYCDVIVERFENFTKTKAKRIAPKAR